MRRLRRRKKTVVNQVIEAVAERAGTTICVARDVLKAFPVELAEAVWAKGRIVWPELASFRVRSRKPRRVANPQTGELMTLPRARAVACRVSSHWRRRT